MPRPDFITEEDILRWNKAIDSSPQIPKEMAQSALIKELCYAGIYLSEQLVNLKCPDSLIFRIQFSAGKASYGKDPWDVHLQFLEGYKNNELDFEEDTNLN